jgi:hypothetical protein
LKLLEQSLELACLTVSRGQGVVVVSDNLLVLVDARPGHQGSHVAAPRTMSADMAVVVGAIIIRVAVLRRRPQKRLIFQLGLGCNL